MRAVMQGIVSLDVGQFFLGLAQMLVSLQVEHDTGAFAFGIGKELFFFDNQRFHGKNITRFKIFRNLFLITGGGKFFFEVHDFLNLD
jgi:hypothetical protein